MSARALTAESATATAWRGSGPASADASRLRMAAAAWPRSQRFTASDCDVFIAARVGLEREKGFEPDEKAEKTSRLLTPCSPSHGFVPSLVPPRSVETAPFPGASAKFWQPCVRGVSSPSGEGDDPFPRDQISI